VKKLARYNIGNLPTVMNLPHVQQLFITEASAPLRGVHLKFKGRKNPQPSPWMCFRTLFMVQMNGVNLQSKKRKQD